MGVHVFPLLNPSFHLASHPIRQDHPSAWALSTLSHASNLDWWSISHMITYMFQCYSLISSHPRLLPQSPKVCSLHLCLFCCLAYRVIVAAAKSLESCLTLCDPIDGSPPGSSIPGILQERTLEWVTIPSSRGSSWPRDWTQVSCIAGRFVPIWAIREALNVYNSSVWMAWSLSLHSSVHLFSPPIVAYQKVS